jgi:hypothetical protein
MIGTIKDAGRKYDSFFFHFYLMNISFMAYTLHLLVPCDCQLDEDMSNE